MSTPRTPVVGRLLTIAALTALLGWPHGARAVPIGAGHAAASPQDVQDQDDGNDPQDAAAAGMDDGADVDADPTSADTARDDGDDGQQAQDAPVARNDGNDADDDQEDDRPPTRPVQPPTDADDDANANAAAHGRVGQTTAVPPRDNDTDDRWAAVWKDDGNPTDDAIQVDDSRFVNEDLWQVDEDPWGGSAGKDEDSVDVGDLSSLRTSKRAPGAPRPPRRPGDDDDTAYSYGGKPVSAVSVPWQAQILYPGAPPKPNDTRPAWQRQHYCGGALIAADWVVTAAHCIDQQRVDLGFKVRLGMRDISKVDGATYAIDHIVRHSQYNEDSNDVNHPPNMYANDIALIHIVPDGRAAPLPPGRIRQIPVNTTPLPAGVPVSVTGWGVTGGGDADVINAVMLRVDLQLMPNPVCQQRPGYGPQKIKATVFCASNPKQSTCRGDSGGPVALTNGTPTLVGIVSWGKRRCAGDGRPGVYTRIDQYSQWISQAMALPSGRNSLP